MYLYSNHIYLEGGKTSGYLEIEEGQVKAFKKTVTEPYLDYQDCMIIPGFMDIHVHGFATGSFWYEKTAQAVLEMAKYLPRQGVTSFLATTGADPVPALQQCVREAQKAMSHSPVIGAEILGVHLEGPFISKEYRGMQPEENCLNPSCEILAEILSAGEETGLVKLMTLAPELAGAEDLIRYCRKRKIQVSIGHSAANYDDILRTKDLGIGGVTHMFSGMKGLHHRELGVAGTALYLPELYCEFAKQTGMTVKHEVFDLTFRIKGSERIILSSDCTGLAQVSDSFYHYIRKETFEKRGNQLAIIAADQTERFLDPKDYEQVKDLELGYLGSVKNMLQHTQMSMYDLIKLTSSNPAKYIGVFDKKGSIAPGKDADLLILDEDFELKAVYCRGVEQLAGTTM